MAWNKYCYGQVVFDNYHKRTKCWDNIYIYKKELSKITCLRIGINTEIALKYVLVLNYILKIQYYTEVNDKR